MASASPLSALQLKKKQQQAVRMPQIPLLSSKDLHPRRKLTLHQRTEDSRQRRCTELLDTVLESLARVKKVEDSRMNTRSRAMKTASSPALASYFDTMSMEKELFDIDECHVVVDNAHILHECCCAGDKKGEFMFERMSRSLSDIPAVSFLSDYDEEDTELESPSCRWDSFNSSSSSGDFSLSIPRRTRDVEEEPSSSKSVEPTPPTPPLRGKRRSLAHAFSLDSTEKLLRQLPLESSSHSASTHSSTSRSSRNGACRSTSTTVKDVLPDTQDMPELSAFETFEAQPETHPRAVRRKISDGSLDLSASVYSESTDDASLASSDAETEEEKTACDEDRIQVRSIESASFDRWSVHSPCKSPTKHSLSLGENLNETPKTEWSANKLDFLARHHISPKILADFPLAASFASPYKLSDDESMGEVFQNAERIIDLRSTYNQQG